MGHLWRKMKVVMWKCLVMRRRHWLLTLCEILIPSLLFGALFFSISKVDRQSEKLPDHIVPPTSDLSMIGSLLQSFRGSIKYCPNNTNDGEIIMKTLQSLLNQYSNGNEIDLEGFLTEPEMMESFQNTSKTHDLFSVKNNVGIVIDELSIKDSIFKYSLRADRGDTASLFPVSMAPGPGHSNREYEQLFLPMQLVVDRSFIKLLAPKAEGLWNVKFQPHPYPSYIESSMYENIFTYAFPFITAFSFIFMFPLILIKVCDEKLSGVKELQQMMGLPSWMIWYGFLFNSLFTAILAMTIVTIVLTSGLTGSALHFFKYSDSSLLFILLFLYVTGCIFYCFLIASIFMKPTPCVIVGMLLWIGALCVPEVNVSASNILFYAVNLFPGYAMKNAYQLFGNFEANGVGMTWGNLLNSGANIKQFSMGALFLYMIASIIIMGLLTWYLDNVRPGPYGLAKPLYFFLQKSYWFESSTKKVGMDSTTDHTNYSEHFEPPPPNSKTGIKVRNLRKNYGNFVAVDDVSIDFYEGQITALLGHNGAGKTTTMSILTGMFPPSSGEVTVQNLNIFNHMNEFRDSLGLCPQHNLLFSYLTVQQHLIFFGMIKGLKSDEAITQGMDLLRLLNMSEKKNELVSSLSGGMKRKLQLAIALIASPKILMLDEPTSGMDPESRREMWDLLLSLRGDRTIIITTHFMEEADVLGDRIAIMDHGKIKCYGTTLFLKRIYGAGYQLTFLTDDTLDVSAITDLIKTYVPDATLNKNTQSSQISYILPTNDSALFPELFSNLEKQKASLGISSIGISCTTVEEVFLAVGKLASKEKSETDGSAPNSAAEYPKENGSSSEPLLHKKIVGVMLIWQRFNALIQKRFIYFKRTWLSNLIHGAAFVVALGFLMFTTKLNEDPSSNPKLTFSPTIYADAKYYMQNKVDNSIANNIFDNYKQQIPSAGFNTINKNANLSGELLRMGKTDEKSYRTELIGGASISMESSTLTSDILYNTIPLHAAPISLNLFSNALLRSFTETKGATITTSNHPIDFNAVSLCETIGLFTINQILSEVFWLLLLLLIMPILFGMFFTFPVVERLNNCKQLQLMTGTSWITYWTSLFTFDFIITIGILTLGVVLMVIVDLMREHYIAYTDEIATLSVLLFCFGLANLLFTYTYSLIVSSSESIGFYYVLNIVLTPIIIFLLAIKTSYSGIWWILYYGSFTLACFIPLPAFIAGIFHFLSLALVKSRCYLCGNSDRIQAMCTEFQKPYIRFPNGEEDENIIMPGYPIGEDLVLLLINIIVHIVVIIIIELQLTGLVAKYIVQQFYENQEEQSFDQPDGAGMSMAKDPDVLREKDRVDGLMNGRMSSEETNQPIFIIQNLKKTFFNIKRKFIVVPKPNNFKAVRGVSFAVSPGECFGLLGVNGAGKTTTFRMLTGDTVCTNGNASLFGYELGQRSKYMSGIGYCPQFNGINEQLTAEEMLKCFSMLRGIPENKANTIINHWIEVLGLKEYRHRISGNYSGGNKRKLSTAMALIGDPPIVFLDEPTSGVDPISRHNLWAVLSKIQKTGQAIVLTSHSMDECEALCNRLTIMVRGEMQCLGNITYLKQRYGQGFTLLVKLRGDDSNAIRQLKEKIAHEFNGRIEIKDEHTGLINYQLMDTNLSWSQMFSIMQKIKQSDEIVEDYNISNTTLEQVFIAFARGKIARGGPNSHHNNTITEL